MSDQLKERTLLFKGKTTAGDDNTGAFTAASQLSGDIDAPWEIQIRKALGSAATAGSVPAAAGDAGITESEAQRMGNYIHRLLKEYMTSYSNVSIQNVRLNVTLKE